MCGIVGYIGSKEAQPIIINGLSRLEYRGYDSAGIATLSESSDKNYRFETKVRKRAGKLNNLKEKLKNQPCIGKIGIGHTRWATHGTPSDLNAHPHGTGGITLVHNGIIENYKELKRGLIKKGCKIVSDTDSEIIAHLINNFCKTSKNIEDAFLKSIRKLRGAFSIVLIDQANPEKMLCAKMATPLVIGVGKYKQKNRLENFVASDCMALLSYTDKFIYLEDGDFAVITKESIKISDFKNNPQIRKAKKIKWTATQTEKGGFEHYMLKEIFEQPQAISDTIGDRFKIKAGSQNISIDNIKFNKFNKINRIIFVACGTSHHAGLLAEYFLEHYAKIPTEVELASEFRYREPILNKKTLVIAISQSGETADTIGALETAKKAGAPIFSICNVNNSAIPRMTNKSAGTLYTRAGPEISVASTKAFVTQVILLYCFSLAFAKQQKIITEEKFNQKLKVLSQIPTFLKTCLKQNKQIENIAKTYKKSKSMLFIGRGLFYPMALEGALKVKEISYIHAEGYAAGEMKHGPIALIDKNMPVVVLATKGTGYDKIVSNLEEVNARRGQVIAICSERDKELQKICKHTIMLPKYYQSLLPLLSAIPLQLLSYHLAVARGCDVDQPRNLAKSVTVE